MATNSLLMNRFHVLDRVYDDPISVGYTGTDSETGQSVLVVRYHAHVITPNLLRILLMIAEKLKSVTHGNLVPFIDYISDQSGFYAIYQMPLDWMPVSRWIEIQNPISPSAIARWMGEMSDVVGYLSRRNLPVGSIAANQVYLTGDGQIKVGHYALDLVVYKSNLGKKIESESIPFWPPELVRSREFAIASDLFSIGVLAYYMASGQYPYGSGLTVSEALAGFLQDPVPIGGRVSRLPEALAYCIDRCCDLDPAARFESPDALNAALASTAESQGYRFTVTADTLALRKGIRSDQDKQIRRIRRRVGILGLIIVTILVGSIGALWVVQRSGNSGSEVQVPRVVGLPADAAIRQLGFMHLQSTTITMNHKTEFPQGTVCAIKPAEGNWVKPDRRIVLFVSPGIQEFPVPNILGQPLQVARSMAKSRGFGLVVSQYVPDYDFPSGNIVDQIPSASALLAPSSDIQVIVGQGAPISISVASTRIDAVKTVHIQAGIPRKPGVRHVAIVYRNERLVDETIDDTHGLDETITIQPGGTVEVLLDGKVVAKKLIIDPPQPRESVTTSAVDVGTPNELDDQ